MKVSRPGERPGHARSWRRPCAARPDRDDLSTERHRSAAHGVRRQRVARPLAGRGRAGAPRPLQAPTLARLAADGAVADRHCLPSPQTKPTRWSTSSAPIKFLLECPRQAILRVGAVGRASPTRPQRAPHVYFSTERHTAQGAREDAFGGGGARAARPAWGDAPVKTGRGKQVREMREAERIEQVLRRKESTTGKSSPCGTEGDLGAEA